MRLPRPPRCGVASPTHVLRRPFSSRRSMVVYSAPMEHFAFDCRFYLFTNRNAIGVLSEPGSGGDQDVFKFAQHELNYIVVLTGSQSRGFVRKSIRGLTDLLRSIARNDVDQADEIERVLPMDNEKRGGLAIEI